MITVKQVLIKKIGNRLPKFKILPVPPVIEFQHQCPVTYSEVLRQVIIGKYQEEVGGGFISPLKP